MSVPSKKRLDKNSLVDEIYHNFFFLVECSNVKRDNIRPYKVSGRRVLRDLYQH